MSYLVKLWKFDQYQYREKTVYMRFTSGSSNKENTKQSITSTGRFKKRFMLCIAEVVEKLTAKNNMNLNKTNSPVALPMKKIPVKRKSAQTSLPAKGRAVIIADFET